MNTVNHESKTAAIKTLAIIGFIAAVVLVLWIAVTLIRLAPSAFSSLASLADSIYGQGSGLIVTADNDVMNSGEPLRMSWMPLRGEGRYTFTYRCAEGISAETRTMDGEIITLLCDEELTIAEGALTRIEQTTDVIFRSEKQRFTDVAYVFAFYKAESDEALYERTGVVTVVNASIGVSGTVAGATSTPDVKPTTPKPTPKPPVKPTTPTYTTSVPVTTTSFPVSNPNGTTDLEVTLVGTGVMKGKTFVVDSSLDADDTAAMQFTVKNIGTKTSGDWTYTATFPSDGDNDFTSGKQSPLLPGERATITLTFTTQSDDGTETAKVSVSTNGDVKSSNNTATKSVKIED